MGGHDIPWIYQPWDYVFIIQPEDILLASPAMLLGCV